MRDRFGRQADYLRISVTDRCNFRCTYCMPLRQQFMPRRELLTFEEIALIADRFIGHGIRKIRITGGEPLVRRDIGDLMVHLGRHVAAGRLDELTMTTNGSLLADHVDRLVRANVRRINVSLDSLDPERFAALSRGGQLKDVLAGIRAARAAGLAVRLNMVAMGGENEDDLLPVAHYCAENGFDLALIETMPLGQSVGERRERYVSLDQFIAPLRQHYKLTPIAHRTAGPARYFHVEGLDMRLGLITPMSENFCADCNRLRLTTDGKIHPCLGSPLAIDLRAAVRAGGAESVDELLRKAMQLKPERHDFERQLADPALRLERHMNHSGG